MLTILGAIFSPLSDTKEKWKGEPMVTKRRVKKGKPHKIQVTFTMPAIHDCDCLYLVGKFDEWPESVYRMQCAEDGTWSVVLELEPGHEYQYRYRTDKGVWQTDLITNTINPDRLHRVVA
jgi:1,4-alpha-glucan branching enzyme